MKRFPVLSLQVRCGLITVALALTQPRGVRAEDAISYKYETWREDDGRIAVDAQYAQIDKDLTADTHLKVMGVIDAISGATPTGEKAPAGNPVPLSRMSDRRKAWNAELAHAFKRVAVTAGYAVSRESDYVSNGWSLNTVTDFSQKNTSLLLGYGRTDDRIMEPKLGWTLDRKKKGDDFIAGVTQLIDHNTSVTANISYGKAHGFMADPYKIVSTTRLDLDPGFYYTPPENRPQHRNKVSLYLGLNRNFERLNGALETSFRYYRDSYGIASGTLALAWIQKIGEHFILEPSVRLYQQSAADFYYYDLDRAGVVTTYEPILGETGTGMAPYYTSDYRMSCMRTIDVGLKAVWKIKPWLALDITCSRYVIRSLDHVTPQDSYASSRDFAVGIKLSR